MDALLIATLAIGYASLSPFIQTQYYDDYYSDEYEYSEEVEWENFKVVFQNILLKNIVFNFS